MKKLYILAVFLLFGIAVMAQPNINVEFSKDNFSSQKEQLKEAKENLKKGEEFYKQGEVKFRMALPFFMKAQEFNPNNAELNFKIGNCILHSEDKIHAWEYLKKAVDLNPKVHPEAYYQLGNAYQYDDQWDNATAAYTTYRTMYGNKLGDADIAKLNKHQQECVNGRELMKHPLRVWIDNLGDGVNSKYPDYVAVITADENTMYFTSRREGSTGNVMEEETGDFFEDVYISSKKDGKWQQAVNLGPPVNTADHNATVGLSPDGTKLVTYRGNVGGGDLFISYLEGNKWSEPVSLGKTINSSSHESSATFSYDGKTIFFVSDRSGGIGGRDIYYSTINEKGKYEKAVNIGPVINTIYDEEGVFMLPDGKTLYFSSKGHNTMGGFDIFKSVNTNGIWSTPENIGYPINDADDDVFFVISASGRRGYYAATHKGGLGEKDLYMITFLGAEKQPVLNTEDNLLASLTAPVKEIKMQQAVEIKGPQITLLKGVITDAFTNRPLEATIDLIDNSKNEILATFKSNSATGKYLVSLPSGKNYGIAVKKEGYLFHSENFDLPATADYQEVTKDIALKNIAVGSTIVLRNIFFDTNKYTLRPESTNELERLIKLLNDVPTLRIELSGHTDNKGSAEMNQTLSENRAKAVVDYLVGKGIAQNRLEFKGYGLLKPVATNDTEAGRQENRRTEFKIIGK